MPFTAIFQKVPEGYIAFVEELPGANTQGKTLEGIWEEMFFGEFKECCDDTGIGNKTV